MKKPIKILVWSVAGLVVAVAAAASVIGPHTDADWVRTLRHGVKPSGEALLIMPSED